MPRGPTADGGLKRTVSAPVRGERAPRELPLSIARGGGVPWRRKPSRHPGATCPALKREEEGEDNDAGAWLVKQCPSWSPAARLDGKGNVDALENEGKQGKTVSWSPTCRILTLNRASSSPCCTPFERAMSPIECCGEDLEEGGSPLAMPLCAVGPPPLGAACPPTTEAEEPEAIQRCGVDSADAKQRTARERVMHDQLQAAQNDVAQLLAEARERDGAMQLVLAALDKARSHIDDLKRDGRRRERDFASSHAALLELAEERTFRIEKLLVALGY